MAANSQYTFSQASGLVSELKAGIKSKCNTNHKTPFDTTHQTVLF
jgi:hypothetical protein